MQTDADKILHMINNTSLFVFGHKNVKYCQNICKSFKKKSNLDEKSVIYTKFLHKKASLFQ